MKIISLILIACGVFETSFAQKIRNEFFAFHNMIRGDSTYDTFDKQVSLIKSAGYEGMEIGDIDAFEGMKAALDRQAFKASSFYIGISLDTPCMDHRLEGYIRQLKGSKTILAAFITSQSKFSRGGKGDHQADSLAIRLLRQLADWAAESGLEVAIYPHFGFYVADARHALSIVKAVQRKNIGLTFNLCHWLATTQQHERGQLKPLLKELRPYLKMITICGANNIDSRQQTIWDDYILPLGTGSFDTYGLLKYCLRELKLQVPVGVQCFNIRTDHYQLVQHTMVVWKQYKTRLVNAD